MPRSEIPGNWASDTKVFSETWACPEDEISTILGLSRLWFSYLRYTAWASISTGRIYPVVNNFVGRGIYSKARDRCLCCIRRARALGLAVDLLRGLTDWQHYAAFALAGILIESLSRATLRRSEVGTWTHAWGALEAGSSALGRGARALAGLPTTKGRVAEMSGRCPPMLEPPSGQRPERLLGGPHLAASAPACETYSR